MIVIGDIHGKFDEYLSVVATSEYSVQVGDFGFNTWNKLYYSGLDSKKHKVIPGNHDDYDICQSSPYCLIDFGVCKLDAEFFYIRGGVSIDRTYREVERINNGRKTYWHEEELNFSQMLECLSAYKIAKPDLVISHAPPGVVIPYIHKNQNMLTSFGFKETFVENTSLLGNELLSIHRPKKWIFGHHHKLFKKVIKGTEFIGLGELDVIKT